MQENRSSAFSDERGFSPPDREDSKWQVRVLSLVLSEWPKQLSQAEIARELLADKPTWEERDALERAITDLASAGLLRECEVLILPTRAALHFASLELE
jgi:hypothetical protein